MALNDVPLNDAGRDYYARQFGSRIQSVRKRGAAPPTSSTNPGCARAGVGVGVGVICLIARLLIGFGPSSSTYSPPTYTPNTYYTPPQIDPPAWQPPPQFDRDDEQWRKLQQDLNRGNDDPLGPHQPGDEPWRKLLERPGGIDDKPAVPPGPIGVPPADPAPPDNPFDLPKGGGLPPDKGA
jgi:hypothetical protein